MNRQESTKENRGKERKMPLEVKKDGVYLDKFNCNFGFNSDVEWEESNKKYKLTLTHTNCTLVDFYCLTDNTHYQHFSNEFSFEEIIDVIKKEGVGGLNIGNKKIWYFCKPT